MFCKNCGAQLDDGARFCGNCGAVQDYEEPAAAEAETPVTGGEYTEPEYEPAPDTNEVHNPFEGEDIPHVDADKVSFDRTSPEYAGSTGASVPSGDLNTTLWIVLSAVEIITCCALIPGIIGLIFAILANNSKNSGNYADAEKYLKYSKIAVLVGLALSVIMSIISMVSGLFSSASTLFNA